MKISTCVGLLFGLLVVIGCQPANSGGPPPDFANVSQERPAIPAPKTVADAERLGIPIYPQSVFDEESEHSRLDEKSFGRTYFVKLYAPADVTTVVGYMMKNVKDGKLTGGAEIQQIRGKSKDGDDLDIRLGPAADHKRTMLMVWLTQTKNPQ